MEGRVLTEHKISTLDLALKSSPARWWDTHKEIYPLGMNSRFLYNIGFFL
jgi:hypothetical protein